MFEGCKYPAEPDPAESGIDDNDCKNTCKRQLEGDLPEVVGVRDQNEHGCKGQDRQRVGHPVPEAGPEKHRQGQNGPPDRRRTESGQKRIEDSACKSGQKGYLLVTHPAENRGDQKPDRQANEPENEHADHADVQARNRQQMVQARLVDMVLPVPVQQRFVPEYHRSIKSRRFGVKRSLCPKERLLPEEFDSASYGIHNGAK